MTWNGTPTPEELQLRWQLRADGYRSAMREIQNTLHSDNSSAAREWAIKVHSQLNWRSLEECKAGDVIQVLLSMISQLERENDEFKAKNQELRVENELFSRSIVSLQERVNTEKTAGKSPERS